MIMNSTSLYVTITQIILKSNPDDPNSWKDLYLLIPYLRNSICCVVCDNLLIYPLTPKKGRCQHHLCQKCMHGRKKIKPACIWCKECSDYNVNTNLRILLQCYKRMCMALVKSTIFKHLIEQASYNEIRGMDVGSANLIILIKEGAAFQDSYESKGGLPKSAYRILPCIYANHSNSRQTPPPPQINDQVKTQNGNVTNENRRSLYSVMFAETGNKITIKKKTDVVGSKLHSSPIRNMKQSSSKKSSQPQISLKQGCRCGNATLTPGKLTCCGQRCPCYVSSKSCQQCKCRGCRNPHESDGNKVVPGIMPLLSQIKTDDQIEDDPLLETTQLITTASNGQMKMQYNEVSVLQGSKSTFNSVFSGRKSRPSDFYEDESKPAVIVVDI